MTKVKNGKVEGGLNGGGDAECYVFAVPDGIVTPLLEHVIYKVAGERTASGLCDLFGKRTACAPAGTSFRHLAALSFGVEDQIIMEEVLDCLDGYGHPDANGYAAKPSAEVMWRAQCAARARKWDRRLREKLKSQQALKLEAMLEELLTAKEAGFAAPEMNTEEKLKNALRLLRTMTRSQASHPANSATVTANVSGDDGRTKIGRLEYRPDFCEVWVDGQRFDLTTRVPARRCLQFLVEQEAFTEQTARDFTEIHAFVAEQLGSMANEPRIHHYFNDAKRKLTRLRSELIKPVARTGRYYLAV